MREKYGLYYENECKRVRKLCNECQFTRGERRCVILVREHLIRFKAGFSVMSRKTDKYRDLCSVLGAGPQVAKD